MTGSRDVPPMDEARDFPWLGEVPRTPQGRRPRKESHAMLNANDIFGLPFLRGALYGVIEVDDLDEFLQHSTPSTAEQTNLSAVLKSFTSRGWVPSDTWVNSDGWTVAFSPYEHWSLRPLVVAVRGNQWVVVAGEAQATNRQRKAWFGCNGVPHVIADRFAWRKAVDVCRLIVSGRTPLPEGWEPLAFDDSWHDIHGGTIGRWATPWGEVALKDDDDGRGYLTATTTARDMIAGMWEDEEK